MITLFRTEQIHSITEVKEKLRALINELPQKVAFIGEPRKVLRYEFVCEPINILAWLHNQNSKNRIYWSNRDEDFSIAGIETADQISGKGPVDFINIFNYMEDHLSADNPNLRYYGGFSFSPAMDDSLWKGFGSFHFQIPRFEFYQSGEEIIFAFNIAIKDIEPDKIKEILNQFDGINFNPQTSYRQTPRILSRKDLPNRNDWEQIFEKVSVIENEIQKIVLARKSEFEFDVEIRPSALIKHLKDKTPHCYHFCFQVDEHSAFLGATPERLYKRTNNLIESEALAGTSPRGISPREDAELSEQLLNSKKNALEHGFVVTAIEDALAPFCDDFHKDPQASVLKLKGALHLITRFKGVLDKTITDAQIITSLHPTPAVAGLPTRRAIQLINEIEPFERGWYAAPVGYFGFNQSEFAVAIRSGLVHQRKLLLFAGAGIVEGSKVDEEWDEIENKISRFMKVFQT